MFDKNFKDLLEEYGLTILYCERDEITKEQVIALMKKDFYSNLKKLSDSDQEKLMARLGRTQKQRGL